MSTDTGVSSGPHQLMLYAIAQAPGVGPKLLGIKNQPVRWIPMPSFGAFVSDIDLSRIRPQRAYLEAYLRVIADLMERMSLLPVSFGSIVNDEETLVEQLTAQGQAIEKKLNDVADAVEMDLKITTTNIYQFIAERDAEIHRLQNYYKERPDQISREVRIEVGSNIDKALSQYRNGIQAALGEALRDTVKDMKVTNGRPPCELLDLCFLIEKTRQNDFEARIQEFARQLSAGPRLKLVMNGPMAPFNFSSLPAL